MNTLGHMLPGFAFMHHPKRFAVEAQFARKLFNRDSRSKFFAKCKHFLFGQHGAGKCLTNGMIPTTLLFLVVRIVLHAAKHEVMRVNAARIVASMHHNRRLPSRQHDPIMQFICEAVCANQPLAALPALNDAITIRMFSAIPFPAFFSSPLLKLRLEAT